MAIASLAAFAGFLGLSVTQDEAHPRRGVRLALGVAVVLSSYLLYGLPWPPRGREWGATLVLALSVAVSLGAIVLANRASRLTTCLVGAFGLYGVFVSLRFVWYLGVTHDGPWRPAVALSYLLAISLAASWGAAFMLLVRARRQQANAPQLAPAT